MEYESEEKEDDEAVIQQQQQQQVVMACASLMERFAALQELAEQQTRIPRSQTSKGF